MTDLVVRKIRWKFDDTAPFTRRIAEYARGTDMQTFAVDSRHVG